MQATRIGGYLLVIYGVLQFFCGPVVGNLSDRFGRRKMLGIYFILMALPVAILMFEVQAAGWIYPVQPGEYGPPFVPPGRTSKCRCAPVDMPEEPTSPMCCPALTRSPT